MKCVSPQSRDVGITPQSDFLLNVLYGCKMLCNGVTNVTELAAKMVIVCCDRMYTVGSFSKLHQTHFYGRKIFLERLFCAPSSDN